MQGDYAMIAEGMGARGLVVKDPGELGTALKKAQDLNKQGKRFLSMSTRTWKQKNRIIVSPTLKS